jgi:hypothetical protein
MVYRPSPYRVALQDMSAAIVFSSQLSAADFLSNDCLIVARPGGGGHIPM